METIGGQGIPWSILSNGKYYLANLCLSQMFLPAVQCPMNFQVSGHTFLQPKQRRKCEYLHDSMCKRGRQTGGIRKSTIISDIKTSESFLWGLRGHCVINNAHKSILAVNTARYKRAITMKSRDIPVGHLQSRNRFYST